MYYLISFLLLQTLKPSIGWTEAYLKISPPDSAAVLYYQCSPKYGDRKPFPLVTVYYKNSLENGVSVFKRVMLRDLNFQDTVERYDWQEASMAFRKRWNADGSVQTAKVDQNFKQRVQLKVGNSTTTDFTTVITRKSGSEETEKARLTTKIVRKIKLPYKGKAYEAFEVLENWVPNVGSRQPFGRLVQMYSPKLKAALKTQFFQRGVLLEECNLTDIINFDEVSIRSN